jgi:hypothetical protein
LVAETDSPQSEREPSQAQDEGREIPPARNLRLPRCWLFTSAWTPATRLIGAPR